MAGLSGTENLVEVRPYNILKFVFRLLYVSDQGQSRLCCSSDFLLNHLVIMTQGKATVKIMNSSKYKAQESNTGVTIPTAKMRRSGWIGTYVHLKLQFFYP